MVLVIVFNFLVFIIVILSVNYFPNSAAEEIQKPKDQTVELVNNLRLTHWDDWDANATCSIGFYVIGLRLRYEVQSVQNKNVSTVTGFELICSNRISARNKTFNLTTFGKGGTWGNRTECNAGFVIGIATILSPSDIHTRSNSHIISLNMYCSNSRRDGTGKLVIQHPYVVKPEMTGLREFEQFCDTGDAITGINIRADSVITFYDGDSTSIKGIGMQCRRVNNPARTCSIIFKWETRPGLKCTDPFIRSNTEGGRISHSLVNCTFQTWIGIGANDNQDAIQAINSYSSVGANNGEEFAKWIILKKLLRPDIKKWFSDKFPDKPRVLETFAAERLWKKIHNITGSIDFQYKNPLIPNNLFRKIRNQINLTHEPVLEQLVGHCSIYKVAFDLFKTKHHVYFEQSIKKRLTRILFEL